MERCFTISKGTDLYEAYKKYEDNVEVNNEIIKKFMNDNGIETELYCPISKDIFAIVPTDADKEKFGKYLTQKDWGHGLRAFNKSCKVSKEYAKLNLTIVHKPFIGQHVSFFSARTRLFMLNGILYATLDSKEITPKTDFPKGWQEIKRSEFYKILEDNNNE